MMSKEEKELNSIDNLFAYLINTKTVDKSTFNFIYKELKILPDFFERQIELYRMNHDIPFFKNKKITNMIERYKNWCDENLDLSEIKMCNKEELKNYEMLITDYIVEDLPSIKDYCDLKNISEFDFVEAISHLKKQSPKYYNSLLTYLDAKIINKRLEIKQLGEDIIAKIINNPNYDILDFAEDSNISIHHIINIVGDYWGNKEVRILQTFDSKNHHQKKFNGLNIIEIFAMKEEVNFKRDENDKPIPGTGRVITKEEKAMIINYINNKPSIYFGDYTYKLAKMKYINDDLFKEKVLEKVRSREK